MLANTCSATGALWLDWTYPFSQYYYALIMASERFQRQIDRLLDESLAISTELGMRPLMERVLSRRDILKA